MIRSERAEDHAAVRDVVRAAFGFGRAGRPDHGEEVADFVERLRTSENAVPELALVALDDSRVVGHVMLSYVPIEGGSRERLLVLTPMSVRPDRQRQGIGRALIDEALRLADARGEPVVLVEGIPAYYPRFSFEPAKELGFVKAYPQIPDEAFMARRLSAWDTAVAGRVVYPPAYDGLGY